MDVGRSCCLLPAYRSHPIAHVRWGALRGPMQTSQGKGTGCTAAPGPNTAPISQGQLAIQTADACVKLERLYPQFG
jgi:hypothetical protein